MAWYGERRGEFNQFFALQVKLIAERFSLRKSTRRGVYESSDFWLQVKLANSRGDVYMNIKTMDWLSWHESSSNAKFQLDVQIGRPIQGGRLTNVLDTVGNRSTVSLRLLMERSFRMEFPVDYPKSAPRFHMDDPIYVNRVGTSNHDHHVFPGGVLCILRDHEWVSEKGTSLSALMVALDHLVWHYNEFGW